MTSSSSVQCKEFTPKFGEDEIHQPQGEITMWHILGFIEKLTNGSTIFT